MPDSQNPFAAPQHDSPTPVEPPPLRPVNGFLQLLGFVEICFGVLSVLAAALATVAMVGIRYDQDPGEPYRVTVGSVIGAVAGVWCIAAGHTLRKGASRRTVWLQLGPALLLLGFIWTRLRPPTFVRSPAPAPDPVSGSEPR